MGICVTGILALQVSNEVIITAVVMVIPNFFHKMVPCLFLFFGFCFFANTRRPISEACLKMQTNLWFLKSFIVFFIIGAGTKSEHEQCDNSAFTDH